MDVLGFINMLGILIDLRMGKDVDVLGFINMLDPRMGKDMDVLVFINMLGILIDPRMGYAGGQCVLL